MGSHLGWVEAGVGLVYHQGKDTGALRLPCPAYAFSLSTFRGLSGLRLARRRGRGLEGLGVTCAMEDRHLIHICGRRTRREGTLGAEGLCYVLVRMG